jgi:hypothetical protein
MFSAAGGTMTPGAGPTHGTAHTSQHTGSMARRPGLQMLLCQPSATGKTPDRQEETSIRVLMNLHNSSAAPCCNRWTTTAPMQYAVAPCSFNNLLHHTCAVPNTTNTCWMGVHTCI